MKGSRPFCVSMCQGFGLASRSDTLPCNTERWRSKSKNRKIYYPETAAEQLQSSLPEEPLTKVAEYTVYKVLTCESPNSSRAASPKSL